MRDRSSGHASRSRSPKKNHHHVRGGRDGDDGRGRDRGREPHHHHGRFLVKRHPNKHAEGTRKRWQDAVGAAERKRYEGVWAANRGLILQGLERVENTWAAGDDRPGERVHAYVVRDLWARSGLGERLLGEIWELVRGGGRAAALKEHDEGKAEWWRRKSLRRHEFVVGMWLVDSSLKGKKLPTEVSKSVWGSVRGLVSGVTVR